MLGLMPCGGKPARERRRLRVDEETHHAMRRMG
jgi:hypothetical protein